MKKIVLGIIVPLLLTARIIDAIAVLVNKESITLYEITSLSDKMHISNKKALEILIRDRLEKTEIKKRNIEISDFEFEKKFEEFIAQKGLSKNEFREILEKNNINWEKYKRDFKQQLLKTELYNEIFTQSLQKPTDEEIESYYKKNIQKFSIPNSIDVIRYISNSKRALGLIIKNPLISPIGVETKTTTLKTAFLNSKLKYLLQNTKEGSFTPIVSLGNRYLMFFVKRKRDVNYIPLKKAKNQILMEIVNKKRNEALQEYFAKLKASSKIKVLRLP
jgi:parvulin-like peptidyl-prolyl isomerase